MWAYTSEVINIEDVSLKFPGHWTNRTAMKIISVCLPAEELKYDFVSLRYPAIGMSLCYCTNCGREIQDVGPSRPLNGYRCREILRCFVMSVLFLQIDTA